MLRVGVCGDEEKNREYLERFVEKLEVECRIVWFSSEEEVLQNKEEIDIWILNIGEVEESGLEYILKRAERRENNEVKENEEKKERSIVVKSKTAYHNVLLNDIIFAENNGRKIILHLEDKILEFYKKMDDLEVELGQDFFRCHRGYLVAMSKITGYDAESIHLKNGESVYLAKRKYSEFTERYMGYIEGRQT